MKNLLLVLIIFGIPFSLIAQSWQWLYPYPTTNTVIDFCFMDNSNGLIIAENGEIINTNDGCSTWESKIMEDVTLVDIYNIDKTHIWILGKMSSGWSSKYVILKTIDGGSNWNQYDMSSGNSLNCLCFISENRGWAAGSYGDLRMTNDGGLSWTDKSISSGEIRPDIFFIHFIDDQNGVIIGRDAGIVMGKTTDGGNSWDFNMAGVSNNFFSGCFADPDTYFAVGERGLILNTNNYGSNWAFPSNTAQKSLYGICYADNTTGWAVGIDSTVLKTSDGGLSWETQSLGFSSNFVEVKFNDINNGWIMGTQNGPQTNQVFLSTNDGGKNWENKFKTFDEILIFTDVCFVDSTNGWLISDRRIYNTYDGGKTWKLQYTGSTGWGSSEYLYAITFVDQSNGFCIGSKSNKGFLLKTMDGGENWNPQTLAFGPLRDIHLISNLTGWLVGDDGLILRTLNGCQSFEYLASNVTNDIVGVHFLNDNHGWAVTSSNILLRTSDGGLNWTSSTFSSDRYDYGQRVFFCDSLTGFVGSADGLFKTMNGGVTFSPVALTNYDAINDIYFANTKEGWALAGYSGWGGSGGVVYHTNDSGIIWNEVLTSGQTLTAFSFVSEGCGWAVGGNSTIAKYKHGGPLTSVNLSKPTSGLTSYKLHQCYPNPFNPSTTITYDLPKKSFVELKLFDMLGREIKTLVNESKEAGRYQIDLDMQNYASGTYFYRIKAKNFQKTKKLTLLK